MTTFEVQTTTTVKVTLDETKFTPEFMAEFRDGFYKFHTLKEHAEFLGEGVALGNISETSQYNPQQFEEGYGLLSELGISLEVLYSESETQEVQ